MYACVHVHVLMYLVTNCFILFSVATGTVGVRCNCINFTC